MSYIITIVSYPSDGIFLIFNVEEKKINWNLERQFLLSGKLILSFKTYSNYVANHQNFKQIKITKLAELIHNHLKSEFEYLNI